jgi:hypothetical protein
MEKEVITRYVNDNCSIEQLCSEFKVGKLKIKKILLDNNIPFKKRGSQPKNREYVEFSMCLENKVIKCKKCGIEYNDVENKSGTAIIHIKECFPETDIPTKFLRSEYKKEHGLYWHFQYFDVVEKPNLDIEYLKCPECDWKTTDLTNKTGSFTKHITREHDGVSVFLERNENYLKYFATSTNKLEKISFLNVKDDNRVTCNLCGKNMKVISNTHLKNKHNISSGEYKLMFPNQKLSSKTSTDIFRKNTIIGNENMSPTWTSRGELEIMKFIKDLGINVEKGRNRKLINGKEIDLVMPDHKICIEYDGLYYHTEKMGKTSRYHLDKTIECHKIGYDLIHIFEDEWILKKPLIKNKLKHLLNINDGIKIGGRNVKISKISSGLKSKFLDENHIQGNDNSSIKYGSFYNGELVGVMTFNESRNMTKTIKNEFELSRFAIKQNYIISGLASKFLKIFINEYSPESIISFADRRWSPNEKNNLYEKIGFKLSDIIPPKYYYYNSKINRYKRFHKFGFGKNSLKQKYPYLDFTKSEKELMTELGFDRIWDCGLFKYKMDIK